jgi:hypothetical protein
MIGFAQRWSQKKTIDRRRSRRGSSRIRKLLGRCWQKLSPD